MFQRVQSIYLIAAIALIVVSYFLPFGTLGSGTEVVEIRSYGLKHVSGQYYLDTVSSYWFHIPLSAVVLLDAMALLQFRDRKRQIALLRFTFLFYAISFVLLSMYVFKAGAAVVDGPLNVGVALLFPFGALMLNWLAARAIRKDDELVRSVDRIR